MSVKEKRPPISVEELRESKKKSQAEKGRLTYVSGEVPEETTGTKVEKPVGKLGRKLQLGQGGKLILPVVIAVLLSAVMLVQFAPTKSDIGILDGRITDLRSGVVTTGEALNVERGRVDNIVSKMSSYSTWDSLKEYAPIGESSVTRDKVSQLEGEVNSLKQTIEYLESRISELEGK